MVMYGFGATSGKDTVDNGRLQSNHVPQPPVTVPQRKETKNKNEDEYK